MTMNHRLPAAIALLLLALVLVGALAAGCGDQNATTSATAATTATPAGAATASTGATATTATTTPGTGNTLPATTGRVVSFGTEDGVTLGGHLFGSGSAGVILAAITQVRKEGAGSVVLAGASMGGTASLIAGDRAQALSSIRLAGIATLSAPVEFQGLSAAAAVPRIIVPLLFIAAEKDAGAAGAKQLEQLSSGKGDLQIVPGGDHGTDLLTGRQAARVYQLLLDFLKASQA